MADLHAFERAVRERAGIEGRVVPALANSGVVSTIATFDYLYHTVDPDALFGLLDHLGVDPRTLNFLLRNVTSRFEREIWEARHG